MILPKKGFLWGSAALSAALLAGGTAWGLSAGEPRLVSGGVSGYLLGAFLTAAGFLSQQKSGGAQAFRSLGIYFVLKLIALFGGAVLFALTPSLGDFRAYALSFVVGFFAVSGLGIALLLKGGTGAASAR